MINIAIDGTAGSGKTTIAKIIAEKLGFYYLNTGAMYRALGMFCYLNGKDCSDEKDAKWVCDNAVLTIEFDDKKAQHTLINGTDYNKHIQEYIASKNASEISKHMCIRDLCVKQQREYAMQNNVIIEGRDIGSVVLKNAQFKFFFEATPEIRAERRLKQFKENGTDLTNITYEKILEDIKQRDLQDTTRKNSPLMKMPDAIVVDCSKTIQEEVEFITNIIYSKYPNLKKVIKCI